MKLWSEIPSLLFHGSLAGRNGLLFSLYGRLFVVLALANLGEDSELFALLLKAPDCLFETFAFSDLNAWDNEHPLTTARWEIKILVKSMT